MGTIWKFPLAVIDRQYLRMPEGAILLCVQIQNGIPCLWARVDPNAPLMDRTIVTVGTGNPCSPDLGYIGTYQLSEGQLVFHVFEDTACPVSTD